MKYLLVLLVVAVGFWMLGARRRGAGERDGRRPGRGRPVEMVECAHCGVHLPAADAITEGSRLYCSDAHRRLGPAQPPRR